MVKLEKVGAFLDWANRIKEIPGWIVFATPIVGSAWGWLVIILDGIPFWQSMAIGLVLGILTIWLAMLIQRAWAMRGLKTLNVVQLGKDCIQFKTEVFDFLSARLRPHNTEYMPMDGGKEAVDKAMHESWARGVKHSTDTQAEVVRRFSSKAIALSHLLASAGIKAPALFQFAYRAAEIAAWFGAIGELLQNGLLEEAKRMDQGTRVSSGPFL